MFSCRCDRNCVCCCSGNDHRCHSAIACLCVIMDSCVVQHAQVSERTDHCQSKTMTADCPKTSCYKCILCTWCGNNCLHSSWCAAICSCPNSDDLPRARWAMKVRHVNCSAKTCCINSGWLQIMQSERMSNPTANQCVSICTEYNKQSKDIN